MANKAIQFHPEAEREYLAALAWCGDRSQVAGTDFESAVVKAVQTIGSAPRRWPVHFRYFRKHTLHQFPFSIVCQELPPAVIVFAVAHARRRPGYWRSRI